jgi:hypothetical protein
MSYKFTDLLSSLGHGAITASIANLIFWPLHLAGVANASVIAVLFPMGLYYGREIIDQARNIQEDFIALGMAKPQARAMAQSPIHAFFVGWDLDGVLDVLVPWGVGLALAVGGAFVP